VGVEAGAFTCRLNKHVSLIGKRDSKTAPRGDEGLTILWRAVKPAELADIQSTGVFRNLGSAEGKYFSTTAEGAASYAKQAFYGFNDPPYTLIRTEAPSGLLQQLAVQAVDRGIAAVVVPNQALPGLIPQIVHYFPLPPY